MKKLSINELPSMSYACAEAMNTISTNLSFAGENVRIIMLTSCHAHEGKTFVSMNLAHTLSKLGWSVALVDADLRCSVVNSRYRVEFEDKEHPYGLSHLLAGMVDETQVVYETNIPNVYMVPVGQEVNNSLALLVSPHFKELLVDLSQSVDYVIVDAPPVGLLIDAAEIAKSCDGTLMIVNYNSVRHQELIDAKRQLEQSGCRILGAVLNEVALDNYMGRKYYYKSYYNHYGRYYGQKDEKESSGKEKRKRGGK